MPNSSDVPFVDTFVVWQAGSRVMGAFTPTVRQQDQPSLWPTVAIVSKMTRLRWALALSAGAALAACSSSPNRTAPPEASAGDAGDAVARHARKPASLDCATWHTLHFFQTHAFRDVVDCLDRYPRGGAAMTNLHIAAALADNAPLIEALVADGADIGSRGDAGRSPLHFAAMRNGNMDVLRALIAAGAEIDAPDDTGRTPLHDASRLGREHPDRCMSSHWGVASTDVLIAAGADPNATDDYGNTPLHFVALANANAAAVESLIGAGADPNARNGIDDSTPLHFSAICNEPAVTAALLAAGADPRAQDQLGRTPLHQVQRSSRHVDLLIAAGAAIQTRDDFGRTPLRSVVDRMAWEENVLVIEALVAHGADVDARDADGNAPLHRAASSSTRMSLAVLHTLLKAGAEVGARTGAGDTPLHLAAASSALPAPKVIALLDAGASPHDTNAAGQTPAALAIKNRELTDSEALRRLARAGVEPFYGLP